MSAPEHKCMDAGFANAVAQLVQDRGAMRYLVRLLVKKQKRDAGTLCRLDIFLDIRWRRDPFAGDFVKRLVQHTDDPA